LDESIMAIRVGLLYDEYQECFFLIARAANDY